MDDVLISSADNWLIRYNMYGTELDRFRSHGPKTEFPDPDMICVSGDEVFVGDSENELLSVWSVDGQPRRNLAGARYAEHSYHAVGQKHVCIFSDGKIRVLDKQSGAILIRFDVDLGRVLGIRLCRQTVLVLDRTQGVHAFDLRGNPVGSVRTSLDDEDCYSMCIRDCGN